MLVLVTTWVSLAQEIKVNTEAFPPFTYKKGDKVVGFCTEIVEEALSRANLSFSTNEYPWARIEKRINENGK